MPTPETEPASLRPVSCAAQETAGRLRADPDWTEPTAAEREALWRRLESEFGVRRPEVA
jgi:hypothetical protein